MSVICVFGASTTWGAWDPEKGGWVNRLRLFVESQDKDIDIYNLGISGDSTADLLERFDVEAAAREPNLIVFSMGDNDTITSSRGEYRVPLEQYERNIRELIKKSRSFTDKVVFMGIKKVLDESKTTPVSWNAEVNYRNADIEKYNARLRSICESENVLFLEVLNLMTSDDIEDGLHPNSRGHEKIFLIVRDFLVQQGLLN